MLALYHGFFEFLLHINYAIVVGYLYMRPKIGAYRSIQISRSSDLVGSRPRILVHLNIKALLFIKDLSFVRNSQKEEKRTG